MFFKSSNAQNVMRLSAQAAVKPAMSPKQANEQVVPTFKRMFSKGKGGAEGQGPLHHELTSV